MVGSLEGLIDGLTEGVKEGTKEYEGCRVGDIEGY
jgi:hypothetical protein